MEIKIDTKEDSHDDIRKVIKMLQHLIGDSQELFTNQPESNTQESSPIANIFGDTSNLSEQSATSEATQETAEAQTEEASESTEDLFAELFSEEEIKKMNQAEVKDEEEEIKPKDKRPNIEFY